MDIFTLGLALNEADAHATETLRRVVNNLPERDDFEPGTIIGWQQSGYLYAAIKTPTGWTTTAGEGNRATPQVPHNTDFATLTALLSLDKVERVGVFLHAVLVKGE